MGLSCLNIYLLLLLLLLLLLFFLLLLLLLLQAEHVFITMTSFSRMQGNTSLSILWNIKCKA